MVERASSAAGGMYQDCQAALLLHLDGLIVRLHIIARDQAPGYI